MAGEIGGRRRRLLDGARRMGFVWNITGQENRKTVPLRRCSSRRHSRRLLYDAINHGKAETGALADFLGGKKRLEDLVLNVRWMPCPKSSTSIAT